MSAIDELLASYGDHLSIDDLSQILNIKRATVHLWLQRGTIPGYKVGQKWVVLTAEVKAMLEASSNQPNGVAATNDPAGGAASGEEG